MSSSFFAFNPFSYDSTSIEVAGKKLSDDKKEQAHTDLTIIRPQEDKDRLMRDIQRDLVSGALVINGVNALELRKRDQFTTVQLEIYSMDEKAVQGMTLEQIEKLMIRHSKEMTLDDQEKSYIDKEIQKIRGLPVDKARAAILSYRESLKNKLNIYNDKDNPEKSFKDYVQFLSKHLLRDITDPEEKEFLARTIASNSHQSGFTKAAGAQYKTAADREFYNTTKEAHEVTIDPPKSICHMVCKGGIVSFKEDARYCRVVDFKIHDRSTHHPCPAIHQTSEQEDDYFARVRSTISIKAAKSKKDPGAPFDTLDLSGDKIFITIKTRDKDLKKILSRVFVDPRKMWQKVLDALVRTITRRKIEPTDSPQPPKASKSV